MAPAPHYTTSALLSPRFHQAQIRRVQFRPNTDVCDAIAAVHADVNNLRCYDVLTLQLGPWHHHGRWTEGYASIRQCVARLTGDQLKAGCVHSIQTGVNQDAPSATWGTSIEFRMDGKRITKEWMTCGNFTGKGFHYRLRYCETRQEYVPWERGWVSVGDNYELSMPYPFQDDSYERFDLRPDGGLQFADCC